MSQTHHLLAIGVGIFATWPAVLVFIIPGWFGAALALDGYRRWWLFAGPLQFAGAELGEVLFFPYLRAHADRDTRPFLWVIQNKYYDYPGSFGRLHGSDVNAYALACTAGFAAIGAAVLLLFWLWSKKEGYDHFIRLHNRPGQRFPAYPQRRPPPQNTAHSDGVIDITPATLSHLYSRENNVILNPQDNDLPEGWTYQAKQQGAPQ